MSKSVAVIRMAAASGVVFAMAVAGHGVSAAQPNESPETKAAFLIKPAVVYMETHFKARVLDANGSEVNSGEFAKRCTGFSVSPNGYIGTAGHCVDPQRDDVIRAVADTMGGQSGKTADQWFDIGDSNWTVQVAQSNSKPDLDVSVSGAGQRDKDVKPVPARVVASRPLGEGDVALLKVELNGKTLPAAELAANAEPAVGEQILAVGYPASTDKVTDFSLDPAVKSGSISAKQVWKTQPLLQISAATSQGMSGGPTVDMKGRVVGIISFNPGDEQQPFNFIVPVQGLKELMQSQGVDSTPNPADTAYRNGIDAYMAGNYTDAVNNLDNALQLSPGYPGAFDLRTDAVKLRAQAGDAGGSGPKPWMFIVAFVVIAALAGGGVLVFVLSRRNKEAALAGGGSWPGDPGRAAPPRPPSAGAGAPGGHAPAAAPGPGGGGGTPPPPSGTAEIHCNNCGYSLAPGAQFCPRCGKPQS